MKPSKPPLVRFTPKRRPPIRSGPQKPMTLIVGLLSSDALIIAADTEESAGITSKRSVHKLIPIFTENWVAVVGGAGDGPVSETAARLLHRKLIDCKQLTSDILSDALDDVLATVYTKYIDPVMNSEGISLIVGASTPEELLLVSTHKRAHQFHDDYAYAGIGADLAIYILEKLQWHIHSWLDAAHLAGFVIKEAKESAQYVGLDSQIFVLHRQRPRWRLIAGEAIDDIENYVAGWQSHIGDAWEKLIKKYQSTLKQLENTEGYLEEKFGEK